MRLRLDVFALVITLFSASHRANVQATLKANMSLAVPEAEDPDGAERESQLKPAVVKQQPPLSHTAHELAEEQPHWATRKI